MPEVKRFEGDRSLGVHDVDFSTYAYRDRKREQLRLEQLHEKNEGGGFPEALWAKKKGEKRAWSQQLEAKDERERRREKKRTRREAERWEKMTAAEKEKQRELERMIETVKRKQVVEEQQQLGEFHGFDD